MLILGPTNLPAAIPGQASQLYSHNATRFLTQILKDGQVHLDFDDVVISQTCITHDGKPMGEQIEALLQGATRVSPGQTLALGAFIFALAVFVGFLLISKVPTMLHTPLMSGTNFIHGIVLVGALTVAAAANDTLGYIIAIAAVLLGTLNVVGGWVVTDRMLQMFRRRLRLSSTRPRRRRRPPDH